MINPIRNIAVKTGYAPKNQFAACLWSRLNDILVAFMIHETKKSPSRALPVFLVFLALSVVYSWPLVNYISDGIPYAYVPAPGLKVAKMAQGDHLQAYHHIGLTRLAADGKIKWFTDPLEFATDYQKKRFYDYFLPVSLLSLPISYISMILAYNILALVTFALCGLTMYLWATDLTGSRFAGFAAGVVFNFLPLRQVELYGGHPAGFAMFLFPLALFFFDRAINRRSWGYGVAGGLAVASLAFQYLYFCYYLLMLLMFYMPWRILPIAYDSYKKSDWTETKKLAAPVTCFLIGVAAGAGWMLYFKKTVVAASTFAGGRTFKEISAFSPELSAIWNTSVDFRVYIGLPMVAFFAVAISSMFGSMKKDPARRDMLFFLALFLITYILAFGVTLNHYLPLYKLFYNYFPYFSFSRAPAKIMVISGAAIAVLTAYFTAAAMKRKSWLAGCVVILAVTGVDYHPKAIGICLLDENNPIYTRIAGMANGHKVLNLPIWPGESSWESIYEYYALTSVVPMINGYSPVVSPEYTENVFWPLFSLNSGEITEEQYQLLKKMDVKFVVFHEEAYPDKVSAFPSHLALLRLQKSPYIKLLEKREPLWLFTVNEQPEGEPDYSYTSPIGFPFQAEWFPKIAGKSIQDKTASAGTTLCGDPADGKSGFMNIGPYKTFPGGKYVATYKIKTSDNTSEAPIIGIDVTGDKGRAVVAQKEIRGIDFARPDEYQEFTLEYDLVPGKPWQMEFRSRLMGAAKVCIDTVYVHFAEQTDPGPMYEAEDLYHMGRIINDPEASGQQAVQGTGEGFKVFGPDRIYEAGAYKARIRMKAGPSPSDKPHVKLQILFSVNLSVMTERTVMPSEFPPDSKYHDVEFTFRLAKRDAIEFNIKFMGLTTLTVDKIDVERTGT